MANPTPAAEKPKSDAMFRNAKGQMVPEKYRGTKTYRLKNQPHYRSGTLYQVGELVTVTDEIPSRTWELVEAVTTVKHVAVQPQPEKVPSV